MRGRIGLVARAQLNTALYGEPTETTPVINGDTAALMLQAGLYGGLRFYGYKANSSTTLSNPDWKAVYNTLSEDEKSLLTGSTTDSSYILYYGAEGNSQTEQRTMTAKLSGNNIKYSLDGNVIFDSSTAETINYVTLGVGGEYSEQGSGTITKATYNAYMDAYKAAGMTKGTVGFTWGQQGGNIYNISVKLNVENNDDMPSMADITALNYYAVVNTKARLSDIVFDVNGTDVNGNEIVFEEARTAEYQIVNGYFLAFKAGEVTLSGTHDGEAVEIPYVILENRGESLLEREAFADINMTVAPVLTDDTAYTVSIDESEAAALKYGTLRVSADNKVDKKLIDTDETGTVYTFNVLLPETMVLSAEYVSLADREANIYPLCQNVRVPEVDDTAAIKFVTRIPQIKMNSDGNTAGFVNGYSAVGTLIIPLPLFDSSVQLPSTSEGLADEEIAIGIINSEGNRFTAQNIKFNTVETLTEAYADISVMMENIPETMYDVEIMAIPYLIKSDGTVIYPEMYNQNPYEPFSDSFNGIINRTYPTLSDEDKIIGNEELYKVFTMIGTDNEYDNDENTTAITYGLNEEITFKVKLAGQYKVGWKLYVDETLTESGEVDGKRNDMLAVKAKLTHAGTASLVLEVYDAYGELITFFDGNKSFTISAAADYQNVNTPSSKLMSETAVSEFYATLVAENSDKVSKINSGITSSEFKTWLAGNKAFAFVYTHDGSEVFSVTYVGTAEQTGISYDKYEVAVVTGNTVGLVSEFVVTVPQMAVSQVYDISALFNDYGVTTQIYNYAPNTISLCVTSDATVIPNDTAVIEETYEYSVVLRDYLALQFAKALPNAFGGSIYNITTTGNGFGGWRALLAAVSDGTTDICYAENMWLGGSTDAVKPLLAANAIKAIDNVEFTLCIDAKSVNGNSPLWNYISIYNNAQFGVKLGIYQYGLPENFEYALNDGEYYVDLQKNLSGEYLITESELESVYRAYTEKRITEIRTTKSNIVPTGNGTAYYISNDGEASNNGLTPETAVDSYNAIKTKLKTGDVVYFERGGIWRETVAIARSGITISAYGDGAAPIITASPANSAQSGYWLATDVENVYVYKDIIDATIDIGSIIFNDTICAFKSVYKAGDITDADAPKYANSYDDLKQDLQMYHDFNTGKVYLYSVGGNPADRFDSIEMIGGAVGMKITVNNVTVDGINFKNCFFGISASSVSSVVTGLTVQNCEFKWIGGNISSPSTTNTLRYGNGIEIWGGAVDFTVENNYFCQNFDAGATFQWADKDASVEDKSLPAQNIKFNDNVFDNCNYSIEYWIVVNDYLITDFEIKNNLCWYAGMGLCGQRIDKGRSAHIQSSDHANHTNPNSPIVIENNLFALGRDQLCYVYDEENIGANFNNNVYAQYDGVKVGTNAQQSFNMDENVYTNLPQIFRDNNAKIITVSK